MLIYLYYILLSATLLPFIDRLREIRIKGKKDNVNHAVSLTIAIVAAVGLWLAVYELHFPWWVILYPFGCMAARGLVYDGMLNLMNRLPFHHLSTTTNAKTDAWMRKYTFWQQRLIAAIALGIVLIIQHIFV